MQTQVALEAEKAEALPRDAEKAVGAYYELIAYSDAELQSLYGDLVEVPVELVLDGENHEVRAKVSREMLGDYPIVDIGADYSN